MIIPQKNLWVQLTAPAYYKGDMLEKGTTVPMGLYDANSFIRAGLGILCINRSGYNYPSNDYGDSINLEAIIAK